MNDGNAIIDILKYSKEGTISRILYDKKVLKSPNNIVKSDKVGFERATKDRNFVYLNFEVAARGYGFPCFIEATEESFKKLFGTIALQPDSPLQQLFDYHVQRLRENGQVNKIFKRYEPSGVTCPEIEDNFGLSSVIGIFGIVVLGLCSSLIIISLEHFIKLKSKL